MKLLFQMSIIVMLAVSIFACSDEQIQSDNELNTKVLFLPTDTLIPIATGDTVKLALSGFAPGSEDPLWDPKVRVTLLDPLPNDLSVQLGLMAAKSDEHEQCGVTEQYGFIASPAETMPAGQRVHDFFLPEGLVWGDGITDTTATRLALIVNIRQINYSGDEVILVDNSKLLVKFGYFDKACWLYKGDYFEPTYPY